MNQVTMKTMIGDATSSQSCSCTSCIYRSDSNQSILKKLVSRGEKLSFEKNIPLRKRQLLNKLVRTRAVYDDIRNQLISESLQSIREKADLTPRKHVPHDATTSSAILELVNLVDKGAVLRSRGLSECCSCCSCGSLTHHGHQGREFTHKHELPHIASLPSMSSARRAKYERRKVSKPHEAKQTSSAPCTCTAQFSGLLKTESKSLIKKVRGKKAKQAFKPPIETFDDNQIRTGRKVKPLKFKQKGMGESVRRSLIKLKPSSSGISKKLKSNTKTSLEIIKKTQQKINRQVIENTHDIVKPIRQKKELSDNEIVSKVVRDSLTLYKKGLKFDSSFWDAVSKTEERNKVDANETIENENIKMRNTRKTIKNKIFLDSIKQSITAKRTNDENVEILKAEEALPRIDGKTSKHETVPETEIIKNQKGKKKSAIQENCLCANNDSKTVGKTKTQKSSSRVFQNSLQSAQSVPKNNENQNKPPPPTTNKERNQERQKYIPKKSTNFTQKEVDEGFNIKSDFRTYSKSSNTSQSTINYAKSGRLALKRCFCTLKLKSNKKKSNVTKMNDKNLINPTVSKSLLPYECEPMVCVPDECDPVKCFKLIRKRGMHHSTMTTYNGKHKTILTPRRASESVSSESPNIIQKAAKRDDTKVPEKPIRQAVRISSNFSFKIEFYKDKGDYVQNNLNDTRSSIIQANKLTNQKHARLAHKPSQTSSFGKSEYNLTQNKLKRCFCTLKLAKSGHKKVQSQTREKITSQERIMTTAPIVVDRATEKSDRKNIVKYTLLPYECEPGICLSGECDPYQCLDIIKRRNIKTHSKLSGTDQRKTKSTYSITRRKPLTSGKSVNAQSVTRQIKETLTSNIRPIHRVTTSLPETPYKQAIHIGSSFSFNVEFYKEKTPTSPVIPMNQVEAKNIGNKTISKNSKAQTYINQQISSTQSVKKTREALTQSNMKRCFCTLKLHKIGRRKMQMATIRTDTAKIRDDMYSKVKTASKSTKTKKVLESYECEPKFCIPDQCHPNICLKRIKLRNKIKSKHLEPHECEPGFCIPGKCDPQNCLERIKVRNIVKSKESGTVTNSTKTNATSNTSNRYNTGKIAMSESLETNKQIKRRNYTLVDNSEAPMARHINESRQVTRIGSNFSFNIEFSEARSSRTPDIRENQSVNPKKLKNRNSGENFSQYLSTQKNSQTTDTKKISKSIGIRPILKRCFCTKKLHENIKNSLTVMPVMLQYSLTTFIKEELIRLQNLLSKQNRRTYANSVTTVFSSSYTESSLYTTHRDIDNYQQKRINEYDLVISSSSLITKCNKENTLNGINRHLKSSFYAMNMQVHNKQKYKHKLKPYECEPNICIPGQCDPYECQKLIMKRLTRKVSTMTYTKPQPRAVSSSSLNSKSKKQQSNKPVVTKPKIQKEQGFKYETLPKTHKQAVRLGSSFNFNIEFSKDRTSTKHAPQEINSLVKRDKGETLSTNTNFKKGKSRSTSGSQALRVQKTSQSSTVMHDKGLNVTPKLKRCFCTLKLHKKGRQNNALKPKNTKKEDKPAEVQTVDTGHNTKKNKPFSLSDLDPNECEPNICIPGECDPYECLERIKKRGQRKNTKDFGTDIKPQSTAASSTTSSQKQASKAKQTYIEEKITKPIITKPVVSVEKEYPISPRQVVRIGSNFSFDIEFFKEKSGNEVNVLTKLPSKAIENVNTKFQKSGIDKKLKQTSIQKSIRHQDSQVILPVQHEKSTKTGTLIQRCFCTLKLHKQNISNVIEKSNIAEKPTTSLMQKCLCALKSLATVKRQKTNQHKSVAKTTTPPAPQKLETSSSAQTKKVKDKRKSRTLEPNECEPGVCVPGECDPLICIERIRKRNAHDKISSTEAPSAKSISVLVKAPKVSKSASSVITPHNKSKTVKPQVKRRSQSEKRAKSTERSAVRIGSNFSFSVEFFKEINPTYQQLHSAVKEIKRTKVAATESLKSAPSKAIGTDYVNLLQNRESQIDRIKKENKASNVGKLKRCFCTLALTGQKGAQVKNNLEKEIKIETATKGTKIPQRRNEIRKLYRNNLSKLEPYECEPGICVPDKCNPYECEKLIKKRLSRDSGTVTIQKTSKTATTTTKTDRKKNHKVQNAYASNRPNRSTLSKHHEPVKRVSISSKAHARQAVKVGSNFSFNIEFSKNTFGRQKNDTIDDSILQPATRKTLNNIQSRSMIYKNKKIQEKRNVQHVYSQVLAKKVRSTVTEVAPLLKRCFCTLSLRNEKFPENLPTKKVSVMEPNAKKVTTMKPVLHEDKINKQSKPELKPLKRIHPNECAADICALGQCIPYVCIQRIKRRMHSIMSNTDAISKKIKRSATSDRQNIIAKREAEGYQAAEKRIHQQSPSMLPQGDRQVIRIGSNFNFNVEFFKDTTKNNGNISPKPEKKLVIPPRKMQSTKTGRNQNHAASGFEQQFVDRRLQSDNYATVSRGSRAEPLIKRCFCTLKLQKVGKLHQEVPKLTGKMKDSASTAKIKVQVNDSKIAKNVGTKTNIKYSVLEPYECEPNTCIPGQCNPLECLKKIKLRNFNEFGTDAVITRMKSAASITDEQEHVKSIQTPMQKKTVIKTVEETKKKPEQVSYLPAENRNRQSVHLGSNFSFNIDFIKESSQNKEDINDVKYPTPLIVDKQIKTRPTATKSQGAFGKSLTSHRGQQARILHESVGSGITPLLKRCFCTLTLHNTETNRMSRPKINKSAVTSQNKSTSTKKLKEQKFKISNYVNSDECEPGVCIPGDCNPYECLERIKKRGIRRQSRTTSPSQRRGRSKASATFQPYKQSKQLQSQETKIQSIVEQPRFPFLDRNNWQSVKIGSNISFNIEFFKETVLPSAEEIDHGYKEKRNSKLKNKWNQSIHTEKMLSVQPKQTTHYTTGRSFKLKQQDEAEDTISSAKKAFSKLINKSKRSIQTVNKTTDQPTNNYNRCCNCNHTNCNCNNNTKGCGCGNKAGCNCESKQNVQAEDKISNAKKSSRKYLTVGRVEKIITPSPFKPNQCYAYRDIQNIQACSDGFGKKDSKQLIAKQVSTDIKTLFPYKPKEYCKNASSTFLTRKFIKGPLLKEGKAFVVTNLPCRITSTHIILSCKEERMILPEMSTVTAMKKFLCNQFTKYKDESGKEIYPNNRDTISSESDTDQLKYCKGDIYPAIYSLTQSNKLNSSKTNILAKKISKNCLSRQQSGDTRVNDKKTFLSQAEEQTPHSKPCNFKVTSLNQRSTANKEKSLNVYYKPGIIIKCGCKCKENILNSNKSTVSNNITSCTKNEDSSCTKIKLSKTEFKKSKTNKSYGVPKSVVENKAKQPCVSTSLVKKINVFKSKTTGEILSVEYVCVCIKKDNKFKESKQINSIKKKSDKTKNEMLKSMTPKGTLKQKSFNLPKQKEKHLTNNQSSSIFKEENKPILFNIWKKLTDVVLVFLAVVVWRPYIFIVNGCRRCSR